MKPQKQLKLYVSLWYDHIFQCNTAITPDVNNIWGIIVIICMVILIYEADLSQNPCCLLTLHRAPSLLCRCPQNPATGSRALTCPSQHLPQLAGPFSQAPWGPSAHLGSPISLWTPRARRTWPIKRKRVSCQRAGSCWRGCLRSNRTTVIPGHVQSVPDRQGQRSKDPLQQVMWLNKNESEKSQSKTLFPAFFTPRSSVDHVDILVLIPLSCHSTE